MICRPLKTWNIPIKRTNEALLLGGSCSNLDSFPLSPALLPGVIVGDLPPKLIIFWSLLSPTINLVRDNVHEDTDFLLGCDHRAVSTAFYQPSTKPSKVPRTTRPHNRCGQWRIDGAKAIPACNALAEQLEITGRDFLTADLEGLARKVSYRPKSHRFKDPPNIKDLIKQRRTLAGREARNLGKDILRLRAQAKTEWLTGLLDKGSQGDFSAIAFFKRRQSVLTTHNNYVARAGGVSKATQDLKHFYSLKYTPTDSHPDPDFSMNLLLRRIPPLSTTAPTLPSPRSRMFLLLVKLVSPVEMMEFLMNSSMYLCIPVSRSIL